MLRAEARGHDHRGDQFDHPPALPQAGERDGIPVVDLDANLDHAITKKAGVDVAFTIGSDNEAAGAKGADYLVGVLGKDAKGPVLVIEGLSGNITGEKRAQGFAEELKKQAPGLQIVASLPGDWDRLKAANITNDILTTQPRSGGDLRRQRHMALGAVETAMPPARAATSWSSASTATSMRSSRSRPAGSTPRSRSCPIWSASRRSRRSKTCSPARRSTNTPTCRPWC